MEVTTVNSVDLKQPKKKHRAPSKRARDAARIAAYRLRLQMVLAANPETHQSADSPPGHPEQEPSSQAPLCTLILHSHWISSTKKALGVFTRLMRSCVTNCIITNSNQLSNTYPQCMHSVTKSLGETFNRLGGIVKILPILNNDLDIVFCSYLQLLPR